MAWERNIKISEDKITFGPKTLGPLDPFVEMVHVHELTQKGYKRLSNAYCMIGRIDREDWLDVLAEEMHTCRADYYNRDGSGINDDWRDYYIRRHSKDVLTVNPYIHRKIPSCR